MCGTTFVTDRSMENLTNNCFVTKVIAKTLELVVVHGLWETLNTHNVLMHMGVLDAAMIVHVETI